MHDLIYLKIKPEKYMGLESQNTSHVGTVFSYVYVSERNTSDIF